MREKRILRLIAAMLVCLLLLPCASAFAEESETAAENPGLIDPNALQAILDAYLASHPGLELNDYRQISVGFCYTETGETWVSNPDHWYYSASLYKVPLMMILAKQEHDGLISQDTDLAEGLLHLAERRSLRPVHDDGHRRQDRVRREHDVAALARLYRFF